HVLVHVLAIGFQIDDGITDDLSGTVVRDVAAAAGFEDVDAVRGETGGGLGGVGGAAGAAHAGRQDGGGFAGPPRSGKAGGLTRLDELALQRERFRIRRQPEPPDLDYTAFGSQFSSCFFTCDMK